MRALTYRGTQRGQAVSHGRSGRLSLQLSQPAPPPLLPIPQGKAGTPISEGEIGSWWSISFSRSLWEVEPGLGLPSCLPSGPPPLPRGCLGTSGWARSVSGFLISRARASWNSSAGKRLDYSRNLWVGRRGQPSTPCCPLGLDSGLLGNWDRSPSPEYPQWHRACIILPTQGRWVSLDRPRNKAVGSPFTGAQF